MTSRPVADTWILVRGGSPDARSRAGFYAFLLLSTCLLACLAGVTRDAIAADSGPEAPADLVYMNRVIYTMRATISGASPALRKERALERLRSLDEKHLTLPIESDAVTWKGANVISLRIGDRSVLTLFAQDLDPDVNQTLEALAEQTRARLADALAARLEMQRPRTLLRGAAVTFGSLVALVLLSVGIARLARAAVAKLNVRIETHGRSHQFLGIDWSVYALRALKAVLRVLRIAALLFIAYVWLGIAFAQFPASEPLAHQMQQFVLSTVVEATGTLWRAAPGLLIVVLVIVVARGAIWMLGSIFRGIETERFQVPGLHPETAQATRRLANIAVWGVAIAIMYPHIPGSDSDVFRALSVFLGFIVTLGSSSIVAQLMSGIVLTYSRSLRVGDFVRVGDVEGVVTELSALSVRITNYRRDEVMVPNSVVLTGAVYNYSRLCDPGGSEAIVAVSIGYDVPWRQVHALLEAAATRTPGVLSQPKPWVVQRGLADFYTQYELIVQVAPSRDRTRILSELHQAVRDEFESAGVAILSPHFVFPPDRPVAVRAEHLQPDANEARTAKT